MTCKTKDVKGMGTGIRAKSFQGLIEQKKVKMQEENRLAGISRKKDERGWS